MSRLLLVLVALAGCGRLRFDPLDRADADGSCVMQPFDAPQPLSSVSSIGEEFGPWLSENRLDLYFDSDRTGALLVYHAHRASAAVAFDPPAAIPLNGASPDDPFLSDDGITMFLNDGPGGIGSFDILVARRSGVTPTFDTPTNALTAALNSAQYDGGPTLSSDLLTMVFASRRTSAGVDSDLYLSTRATPTSPFPGATRVDGLSTLMDDCCASLSGDGQRLVYAQGPFAAHRMRTAIRAGGDFVDDGPLDAVLDGDKDDVDLMMTRDQRTLVFSSNRTGTTGKHDLYIAERSCL